MEAQQAWTATLGQLQMEMPKASYDTWVKNTRLVSYEGNQFVIGVQNTYARDWLENRLTTTARRLLSAIMDCPQEISFIVHQQENQPLEEPISISDSTQSTDNILLIILS
jgi:chromosomal replication initiator protein